MQNVWVVVISSILLTTAACAAMEPVEGTGTSRSNMTEEEIDRTEPAGDDESEESELGYGWETKLRDPKIGNYSLSDIVTSPKVKIRTDGRSCVGCHSWAEYQDRDSFCGRVDAFLALPTLKAGEVDPQKKPANLKKLLRDWKEAGCPD